MDGLVKPNQSKQQPAIPVKPSVQNTQKTGIGDKTNVDMYITYSLDHDVPFLADFYGIGNMIDYADSPYKPEIDQIDDYLVAEVKAKRLENSTEAIKKRLTQLEKVAGIEKYIPTSQRVKTLAAYAKYMQELSQINHPVVF